MTTKKTILALLGGFSLAVSVAVTGCGSPTDNGTTDMPPAGNKGDMATTMSPDMGCYAMPMAGSPHIQIINACTTATQVPANPKLPKLNPDGTLPPLP